MRHPISSTGLMCALLLTATAATSRPLSAQSDCPASISAGGWTGELLGSRTIERELERVWYHPRIGYFHWTEVTETTVGTYRMTGGGSVDVECSDELI